MVHDDASLMSLSSQWIVTILKKKVLVVVNWYNFWNWLRERVKLREINRMLELSFEIKDTFSIFCLYNLVINLLNSFHFNP